MATEAASEIRDDHLSHATIRELLALILTHEGELDQALQLLEEAVDIERKNFFPAAMRRVEAHIQLAEVRARLGDGLGAAEILEEVRESLEVALPGAPLLALVRVHQAHAEFVQGNPAKAQQLLSTIDADLPDDDAFTATVQARVQWLNAMIHAAEGRVESARQHAEDAILRFTTLPGLQAAYLVDLRALAEQG